MAYRRTERVLQRLNARRDSIVDAAHAIAGEAGLAAVQIVPVAARAGMAVGTVYRYFPAKNDLVAALIESIIAREAGAIRQAAATAPGPLSALAAGIVTFAARAAGRRQLIFAALAQPVDGEIEGLRINGLKAVTSEFEKLVTAAVAGNHLPEQNSTLSAVAITGTLLQGLVGPLADAPIDAGAARDMVQALALMVLRGLGVVDARARGLVVQAAWPSVVAA